MLTILIILILISVVVLNFRVNKVEPYNDRHTDYNIKKCAEWCKETEGCYGFGYDKSKNVCYPSKELLEGKPSNENTLYRSEYRKKNVSCNKMQPIIKPSKKIGFEDRRKNSVFVCREEEGLQPQWYLHHHGNFVNLGEGKNLDEVYDIDEYSVRPYRWPINKYSMEQLDLLIRDRQKQTFTDKTVTDMNRIVAGDEEEKPALPVFVPRKETENDEVELDFGLNKAKDYLQNINKIIRKSLLLPTLEGYTHSLSDTSNKKYTVYKVFNDFNTGDHLKPFKCLSGISEKSCLKQCTDDNQCLGVEFNPKFREDYNVCCLKSSIKKFKPRHPDIRLGRFYRKYKTNVIDPKHDYIFFR